MTTVTTGVRRQLGLATRRELMEGRLVNQRRRFKIMETHLHSSVDIPEHTECISYTDETVTSTGVGFNQDRK
jgi:hypothetical protein